MCWRTQRANMEDGYDDTVGRERGIYIRDVTIQYHNNLAAFGDAALMNRCFELYGQSNDTDGKFKAVYPNSGHYTIADFCLNAVEGYHAYYYNTGDLNRIATDWDAIKTNIAWFDKLSDEHADGLLDSEWHIHRNIKAMYGGFHGDLSVPDELMDNTGYHCTFTCAYLITLRCAYNMAMALNKPADAAMYQQRVARLEKTIPQTFWNEEKGAFADNHKKTTYSAHATIFAIRAGVVSANMLEKAKVHLRNSLQSVFVNGYDNSKGVLMGPSFAFYIFDGLYKAGMPDLAENLIREMHGFFLYQGARTTPEHFNMLPSLCHAWSASPIYYLSKYGLGINFPQAPNFNKVEIKVETTHMQWAEGKWPHPNGGVIEVKWHTENGKRVFDYVKGPEGVSITVLS
jgi:hypothetical protein